MSRYVVLRLLETFFRRWWLFLLPLVLLTTAGIVSVGQTGRTYRSMGTFYVESETFLASLTAVRGGNIGWQTPAGYYNQQLAGLLQTDAFISVVAEDAGFEANQFLDPALMLSEVRSSVASWPAGDNLLRVAGMHEDPVAARNLSQSVIENFVEWQIEADISESSAAQLFFADVIAPYEDNVAEARRALDEYLVDHPDPPGDAERPLAQEVAIQRLSAEISVAESRLTTALTKEEEARLATAQTESDVRQRFQVVDTPEMPSSPEPMLRRAVLHVALFSLTGGVLSLAALLAATVLDRAVRSGWDVEHRLDAKLLAVVPRSSR